MNAKQAEKILNSLAHETRIRIYKLLIEHKKTGIYSCNIGEMLDVPQNTTSFHLTNLKNANLVYCEKKGRYCTYFPNKETVDELKEFLFEDCCKIDNKKECKC